VSLRDELQARKAASRERMPPGAFDTIGGFVEELRASGIADRAPQPGDRAPDFTLPDLHGGQIRLGDLLGRSAVVLAFYRGGW
jgi:hypothetical protein